MARPLLSPFTTRYLQAHQYQRNSNDCGPYCAAIAIYAMTGFYVSGKQLADETNQDFLGKHPPFLKRIPHSITFPWGIQEILHAFHCRAYWHIGYPEKELLNQLLQHKVLIIIYGKWLPPWAHYAVLTAYHEKSGYGLINPAHPRAQIEWIAREVFLSLWLSFGRMVIIVEN